MPESINDMNPSPDLAALAESLRSLDPASTTISRDRLLFEAGRAAATPRLGWLWQGGTVAFAGLSLVLAMFVAFPSAPAQVIVERERIIEVRAPAAPKSVEPPSANSQSRGEVVEHDSKPASNDQRFSPESVRMFHVREDVLRFGPEMLPDPQPVEKTVSPPEARDIERWLEVPPGTFAAPQQKAPRLFPNFLGED